MNDKGFPSAKQIGEVIGVCPRCGGDVAESPKAFSCVNTKSKKCGFVLWKDNKYFASKKKSITKTVAKSLLTAGHIFMKDLHSEKTGKTYNATIFLDDTGDGYVNFRMEFEQKNLSGYTSLISYGMFSRSEEKTGCIFG